MPKKPANDAPLPSFGDDDEHASTRAFRSPLLDDDDDASSPSSAAPRSGRDDEDTGRARREPPSVGGVEIDTRPVPLPRFPSTDDVTRPLEPPLQTLPTLPVFADDSTSRPLVPTRSSSRMVVAPWARGGDPDAPASSRRPFAPPTAPTLPIAEPAPPSSSFVPVAAATFTPLTQPAAAPLGVGASVSGFPPSAALAATVPAAPPSAPAPAPSTPVMAQPPPSPNQPAAPFPRAPHPVALPPPVAPTGPSVLARLAWGVVILGVSAVVGGALASWLSPRRAAAPSAPSADVPSALAPAPPPPAPPTVASSPPPVTGGRPAKLTGAIELPPSSAGAQLWLDGVLTPYGSGPLIVPCGRHVVKVAGAGLHPRVASLDVPCGGRIVLP